MNNLLFWNSIMIFFILGMIFYMFSYDIIGVSLKNELQEGFSLLDKQKRRCGNLLVREDNKIKLYNSNVVRVPGVNPIVFDTLDDYTEFVSWQKKQGIYCPVLALQETYDTQGEKTYTPSNDFYIKGSISDDLIQIPYTEDENNRLTLSPQPILDASRDNPPYNSNSYQGYDPTNQQVGKYTKLDIEERIEQGNQQSAFATDPNWGGVAYTQNLIDKGVFDEDRIYVKR